MFKRILFGSSGGGFTDISILILRVAAGLMLALLHGTGKMPPSQKFIDGVAALGFPSPVFFAWCAALAEMAGGLLLAAGLATRPAAFFVAFTMAVAAFGRHLHDPFERKELALLYLAIALFFLAYGGGKWSLDRLFSGPKSKTKAKK